jgi:hypothetical protein
MKKKEQNTTNKIIKLIKALPSKKNYLEFTAALIGIPVTLTFLILNIHTLQNLNNTKLLTPTPSPFVEEKVIIVPQASTNTSISPQPTAQNCIQQIGPVSIVSPQQGQTVTDNPVLVEISYTQGNYCSVQWSYQVNGGPWSGYNNNSVDLYNLTSGNISFNLMVKSAVSTQTETLSRNFTYSGSGSVIPTSTPQPTLAPTPLQTLTPKVSSASAN